MEIKYLLDTNILILYNNSNQEIIDIISAVGRIGISIVSVGELIYGAHTSLYKMLNFSKIQTFINCHQIYEVKLNTANYYGIIRAEQKKKGKPLSHNDLWIASTAMEHDLVLVTRDNALLDLDCVKTEKW